MRTLISNLSVPNWGYLLIILKSLVLIDKLFTLYFIFKLCNLKYVSCNNFEGFSLSLKFITCDKKWDFASWRSIHNVENDCANDRSSFEVAVNFQVSKFLSVGFKKLEWCKWRSGDGKSSTPNRFNAFQLRWKTFHSK